MLRICLDHTRNYCLKSHSTPLDSVTDVPILCILIARNGVVSLPAALTLQAVFKNVNKNGKQYTEVRNFLLLKTI